MVEDEPLISLDIAYEVENLGGSAAQYRSREAARHALMENSFDAAVIDFRVTDGTTTDIGHLLLEKNVPFVFCTGGVEDEELGDQLANVAVYEKPCDWQRLMRELASRLS